LNGKDEGNLFSLIHGKLWKTILCGFCFKVSKIEKLETLNA
jgi:hypothetical protein